MTLAIIGGTGFYHLDGLELLEEVPVRTPYGDPSAPIMKGRFKGRDLLFLARHGKNHRFLPHEVNYRANIFALKTLGATQILGISATGSLREEIAPGSFALPNQYIDFTRGVRADTFFGEGVAAHISTAEPTCPCLAAWVQNKAKDLDMPCHGEATYACVNGPRLGTKAESHFFRLAGCDLVGMTNVPEAFLAREAQMCYLTLGIVTDYDCWMEDPAFHVNQADVMSRYGESIERVKALLVELLDEPIKHLNCTCRKALSTAILTPEEAIPENKKDLLEVLRR